MIETLPTMPVASDLAVSDEALAGFRAFQDRLLGQSQIVWGEHCSECAYPKCYETCTFYTPRADLHCRRFEAGIEPVTAEGATKLHRIRFRQWGKLEGRGATVISPAAIAQRRERRDALVADVVARMPAPYAVTRKLAAQWNAHKEARAQHAGGRTHEAMPPDAFVVETWAADGQSHAFTLTLLNVGESNGRMFQTRFEAGASYQRLTVPIGDIRTQIDLAKPFLIQIEPIGEAAGRDVVFGVCEFVTFKSEPVVGAAAKTDGDAGPVKVVVWDLDETLWTGTLAEDGAKGVHVRPEAVAAVRALDERGVLQSIASKNDAAEALAALAGLGLADYFLHPQIGWDPKSGSVARIAAALDLGPDSFVFIDDQPFERAEVSASHPAVRLLAHTDVAGMMDHPWFALLPVTPESGQRRAMYRAEAARTEAFQSTGDDYLRFLRDSAIEVQVRNLRPADAERVFELSQRTNQLNFRGAKYSREDVQAMLAPDPDLLRLSIRCTDRFGDYGLIGFVVVDLRNGEITDLFMSCRVQRKRVEQAVFAWIARETQARGHTVLAVRHRPTERNAAARAMLQDLGFIPTVTVAAADEGGGQVWRRETALPFEDSELVRVVAGPRAKAA